MTTQIAAVFVAVLASTAVLDATTVMNCLDREVKRLQHTVLGKVMGINMPFVGVDGKTACNNIYEEDGVTKATCPLTAGTTYVYLYQLKVLPIYPSISPIVHWALQDVEQRQDVACFEVQAKIVKQIIK